MSNSYTGRRLVTPQIASVQPSNSGQYIASSVDAFMQSVGKDIIKQSGENYGFKIRNQMTDNINKISTQNQDNLELFQSSLTKYREDLLSSIQKDPQSRLFVDPREISAEFDVIAAPNVKRIYERHKTALDNDVESTVLSTIDISRNSMLSLAPSIYVDGSSEEDINRQMAINIINQQEGEFSDNPADRGGPTKFGITQETLKSLATGVDDISQITKSMASDIIVDNFLIKPGINKLPLSIKAQMLDMSVNHGPENAIKIMQRSMGLKETGKLDQQTLDAAASIDPNQLLDSRIKFYENIVKNDKTQEQFLNGWKNRAINAASMQARAPDDIAFTSAQAIQTHMANIARSLEATKSDGTPIFTPKQKQTQIAATRDSLFQVAAKSWIDRQPNKLAAFSQWKEGGVKIAFPDNEGNIMNMNIREAMSAEVRQKVDADFMRAIKDDFFIQNQIEAREEKEQSIRNKELRNEIIVRIQKGEDMSRFVDAARSDLDPDDYIDLRKMSLSSDPITNADVYGSLLTKAYNGEDVSAQARRARFNDRTLSNDKYSELMSISKEGTGQTQDAIEEARKYLVSNLPQGRENSMEVSQAMSEFQENIDIFREKNGRFPTRTEAMEEANSLLPRWTDTMFKKNIATLPRPMKLPENMRDSKVLKEIDIPTMEAIRKDTQKEFLERYNGDAEAVAKDPYYIREMKTIDNWIVAISQRIEREKAIAERKSRMER